MPYARNDKGMISFLELFEHALKDSEIFREIWKQELILQKYDNTDEGFSLDNPEIGISVFVNDDGFLDYITFYSGLTVSRIIEFNRFDEVLPFELNFEMNGADVESLLGNPIKEKKGGNQVARYRSSIFLASL